MSGVRGPQGSIGDDLPSAASIDLTATYPTQLLITSEQLAWAGPLARVFRHPPHFHLRAPAVQETLVHILHSSGTRMSGRLARPIPQRAVGASDVFIIPQGEPVECANVEAFDVFQLCIPSSLLASVCVQAVDVEPTRIELTPQAFVEDTLMQQIGTALLGELRSSGLFGQLYVEALTQALAIHILRRYAVFPPPSPRVRGGFGGAALRRTLDYIHSNLGATLTLTALAQQVHLSPYHFARLFKQSTGTSVHQYVLHERVKRATELLSTGDLSIAEVAVQVGFHDPSHLYRHFKRITGMTPGQRFGRRKNKQ